ncbi:MAG: sigma-54 interaction domain-containing protein [Acidobacteriaceae bacterium]
MSANPYRPSAAMHPWPAPSLPGRYGMVGASTSMHRLFAQLERIGPHFRTALIAGETGTGKELVARALHDLSPGAAGPFITCNTSALVETLLESELFGHTKGAFTGAVADRVGLFESANKGTLFLDEIGEMPLSAQAKLLRVLQHHEVQRVGSTQARKLEVRVVAATNRDLRPLSALGQFRQDLYYRISMVEIQLPSLRMRPDDIAPLAEHFLVQYAAQYGKAVRWIAPCAMDAMEQHTWPGNVRELENALGNAVMQAQGETLTIADLPPLQPRLRPAATGATDDPNLLRLQDVIQRHVQLVLERCSGNKLRAAELLGISRSTLYRMLDAHAPPMDFPERSQAVSAQG